MRTEIYSFVVISAAVLVLVSLISGGIAIAGSVLYRSTLLRKEIATRRVLGARRSHIARMFLSENVFAIAAGIAVGSIAMLAAGESRYPWFVTVVLISAATAAAASAIGGWIAGRHASKVPFGESGLFRTSSDTRGHS
jgi:ABC-type antimicrobial peptide transport system permease subunit